MIQNDLVSIIIPVYNSEGYLEETLRSAINQTWPSKEIIIIDDGSTDQSLALAKQYEGPDLKVFSQVNRGAGAARNAGYHKSKGQYIQFLDADDILSEDKIEKQVRALEGNPEKAAVCNTWIFTENLEDASCSDQEYLFNTDKPEAFFITLWGGGNSQKPYMIQTSAWLLPRNLIERGGLWNESLARDQDGEFYARIVLQGNGVIYTPGVMNYYRKYYKQDNITSMKQRKHLESMLLAADLKAGYLLDKKPHSNARLAIATQYKWVAFSAWPLWKDIARKAEQKSREYGGSHYNWLLGNPLIELLKKIIGWKNTKALIHQYQKFKTKRRRSTLSKQNPKTTNRHIEFPNHGK
jgi:glycosyltransferase involved in cell wall biosynthesis